MLNDFFAVSKFKLRVNNSPVFERVAHTDFDCQLATLSLHYKIQTMQLNAIVQLASRRALKNVQSKFTIKPDNNEATFNKTEVHYCSTYKKSGNSVFSNFNIINPLNSFSFFLQYNTM